MADFMYKIFMSDLLPIIIIMVLGYVSGKRNVFTSDQAKAFNKLVLNYALPAALFVSIARANREMIFADAKLTIISFVVLLVCFFFSFFGSFRLFVF